MHIHTHTHLEKSFSFILISWTGIFERQKVLKPYHPGSFPTLRGWGKGSSIITAKYWLSHTIRSENWWTLNYNHNLYVLHLPSLKKLANMLSSPHILCQVGEFVKWSLWELCTFCTNITETLMLTNKSFISCVWTIWFPANFLQQQKRHYYKRKV